MDRPNDPIVLTALAVDLLGPASFRTAWNGRAVTVTVPDRETMEIFHGALVAMRKVRSTDGLVRIERAEAR